MESLGVGMALNLCEPGPDTSVVLVCVRPGAGWTYSCRVSASPGLQVVLEVGPKEKRFVAVAADWPGLERGGRSKASAVETLTSYLARYAPVASIAGLAGPFAQQRDVHVVEEFPGTGSTDFWGISSAFSTLDRRPVAADELERELLLMRACWAYFDQVRGRVSAEMRKGPRGGGRDRDRIVSHVLGVEQDWAKKVGVRTPDDTVVIDEKELGAFRDAYCDAIRTYHAEEKGARNWPLRYLVRHTAYHAMDHAWEMEDKDLTGAPDVSASS